MIRLFENKGHADVYAKYRPKPTPAVVSKIMDFLNKQSPLPSNQNKHQFMLDVGCGSGQSTGVFSSYFHEILGIDVSLNQIENASTRFSNIKYKVGSGECFPVENDSVDLILACEAVHWFDFEKFLTECARALKPEGCLALVGYVFDMAAPVSLSQGDENVMKDLFLEYKYNCKLHPRTFLLDDHYKQLRDQIQSEHKLYDNDIKESFNYTLEDHRKSLSTWSGYQEVMKEKINTLIAEHGQENVTEDMIRQCDILEIYANKMKKASGYKEKKDSDIEVKTCREWFVVASSRPIVSKQD